MGNEASPTGATDQAGIEQAGGEPAAGTNAQPTADQATPETGGTATTDGTEGQPDIPTLLIDTVAAVVLKQIKPLMDDLRKIREQGIPLPVEPEKAQVLEIPEINMDLVPGQITLPGNSGAPEPEIPRILIDTVVAVVLKEIGPLLQELKKLKDQAAEGGMPLGPRALGSWPGRGAGAMDEATMLAAVKSREDELNMRVLKFQERYEALKRGADARKKK